MADLTPHQIRDAAHKLSILLAAQNEREIARFKEQRLGDDSPIELEHLAQMRDVLSELALILTSPDAERWRRLEGLAELLAGVAPSPEDEVDEASDPTIQVRIPNPPRIAELPPEASALPLTPQQPSSPSARITHPSRTAPIPPSSDPLQVTASGDQRPTQRVLPFEGEDATRAIGFTSKGHALAMSVEEYAGMCAERDHDPTAVRRIHARYAVVDTRCSHAIDRVFYASFTEIPDERARWQQHYQHYATILRSR